MDDVSDNIMSVLDNMVAPLQSLMTVAIVVDSPPFYILSDKCPLKNLSGVTFTSPYGTLTVHDIETTDNTVLSLDTTVMYQVSRPGQIRVFSLLLESIH